MKEMPRIGLQQRMLPSYRAPFFDALATEFAGQLSLFAGYPRQQEAVETNSPLENAERVHARNLHFFNGRFYLCWQTGLVDWLKRWQPDVLIVEANPRYLSTPAAIRWMKNKNRPVIAWGLGAPATSPSVTNRIRGIWQQQFFKQFDAIIAYSRQGADEYRALGINPERVFVANNAVARRPVHDMPLRAPDFPSGKPTVLFVGRLQARKRVDSLLAACRAMPDSIKPDLWIVGDGPTRAELEKLAETIYPEARFFGSLQGLQLEELFRKADLFVLPGTGGLAVQQAMSFGLPVIVAEADGTQSDLVRPANGWVVPPAQSAALQKTMEQAFSDIQHLRQMGDYSFQIVNYEINLENMVKVFKQAIYSVLEK